MAYGSLARSDYKMQESPAISIELRKRAPMENPKQQFFPLRVGLSDAATLLRARQRQSDAIKRRDKIRRLKEQIEQIKRNRENVRELQRAVTRET